MIPHRRHIIIFLWIILYLGAFKQGAWCALLWKDDFSDNDIFELTWDARNSTGTVALANNRCILNIDQTRGQKQESIVTLPSRSLPPNFDLHTAIEFTNVEGNQGEFFMNIGSRMELVISFLEQTSPNPAETNLSGKQIWLIDPRTGKGLNQSSGPPARFNHKIASGDRCFVTWMSNGESPSVQTIKVGTAPGESNIADFIIESKESVSGRVAIGIRKGLKEARLKYVNAYLFGTSSTLVHDWVLF